MSEGACPFCAPEAQRIFHAGPLVLGLWDAFPVSPGHALLVPKRHVETWFDASEEERSELLAAIERARQEIERHHQPDGYNVGINIGAAAGQTVLHLHVHVIPRYAGDVADPRGGVRFVLPSKANYLAPYPESEAVADREAAPPPEETINWTAPHTAALITGDEDPLLAHLRAHLDRAERADFAVAFLLKSGLELLVGDLTDLMARGGRLRFLTGDYLGVTDPRALLRLLDLREQFPERTELRVFESGAGTFHPKSYIFHQAPTQGIAIVGSSNLTRAGLATGLEWNFRTVTSRDPAAFSDVLGSFERLFQDPRTQQLDVEWVERYRSRRPDLRSMPDRETAPTDEPLEAPPTPHSIQQRALEALEATRQAGNAAGLVVLATGLGKTWLSAFDSHQAQFRRVLFVAHREEILRQAMATFRRIRPDARLGFFTGTEKTQQADVLFASIATLGRKPHLERFGPAEFDYLIIDEFHHAAARTYRRVIDHFDPQFLLGLTATPERTDGGDLLTLCQENLVFRCDVSEGIREGLLSPFHYYGVPDEVDYANIPWRSSRFDPDALNAAVATRTRAENALEQYRERGGTRTLAFCCSTRHADFMRDFFVDEGVRAAAVHSEGTSDPRTSSLEKLEAGDLDVVFAVDMFNEGVDLPDVDTIMMLRPTESRILWLQQFGRGLRRAEGKDRLAVIDYIGNHRTFLLKPQTLFALPPGDAAVRQLLNQLEQGQPELPPGCEVTYELEAINILRALLPRQPASELLRFYYEEFRDRHGVRPSATEMHHEGYRPRSVRRGYGSWLRFVAAMGDLDDEESHLVQEGRAAAFLATVENTPMTRSYKMLVLLAQLNADCFPGEIAIGDLCSGVRRIARRSAVLQRDLGVPLDDPSALRSHLEVNPLAAWAGGKGTGGDAYFGYEEERFFTTFEVPPELRAAFAELVRELADWRLAEYLDRPALQGPRAGAGSTRRFVCSVSHAGRRPMLFLPVDRRPELPSGWVRIRADGEQLEANFVKVALNVVRQPGSTENQLPEILRSWFGDQAGLPGTRHRVALEETADGLVMVPLEPSEAAEGLIVGESYQRAEIPPQFGFPFQRPRWNQGFVQVGSHIFLLVTLDKTGMPAEHRYGERFLARDLFEWQSQNRHRQQSRAGQDMRYHRERGLAVHLLVRKQKKIGKKAAPFLYCGEVEFVDWEGEKPITIRWHLRQLLGNRLAVLFGLRGDLG